MRANVQCKLGLRRERHGAAVAVQRLVRHVGPSGGHYKPGLHIVLQGYFSA